MHNTIDRSTFNRIRRLVYERSGIAIGENKEALVSARVGKRMRALEIEVYRDYLRYVMSDESGNEIVHLLDAISTNVTSFFREPAHFDFLNNAMKKWLSVGRHRFRFWSAACSSGEEPFSLGMTVLDAVNGSKPDIRILATDISTHVLRKAKTGVFSEKKIESIPPTLREKFFNHVRFADGAEYAVRDFLKRIVVFSRLNLSDTPFPMRGPFDLIMCRNVMIYFDNRVRKRLLDEIYRLVRPGGYLMVGHAESLTGMISDFKSVRPSIYLKPE
ncbi:MAG: CheR family methyltransferase [Planctomycetota bacterium]|jgi:chemotaxis protein methyltransferase CheR